MSFNRPIGQNKLKSLFISKKGQPHDFTVNTLIQAHTRARTRTHARAHMHVRAAIAADVWWCDVDPIENAFLPDLFFAPSYF